MSKKEIIWVEGKDIFTYESYNTNLKGFLVKDLMITGKPNEILNFTI